MPTTKTATTDVTPRPKRVRPSRSKAAVAARGAAADLLDPADVAAAESEASADVPAPERMTDDELAANAPRPPMPDEATVLAIEAEPTDVPAAADPMERLAAAKVEHAALAAWWADGGKPPRPATPNLDALHAEAQHPAGAKPRPRKARAPRPDGAAPRTRASITGIYRDAVDRKRQGPRGKGAPVDSEVLRRRFVELHAEHPTMTAAQAQEVAYWVWGYSVSRTRTAPVWEEVIATNA